MAASIGRSRPSFSGIVRAGDAESFAGRVVAGQAGTEDCVNPARLVGRAREVNLYKIIGQSTFQLPPGFAPVGGFEKAAIRCLILVGIFPGSLAHDPHRRVEDGGTREIGFDFVATGIFILVEILCPVLNTAGGKENSAFFAW